MVNFVLGHSRFPQYTPKRRSNGFVLAAVEVLERKIHVATGRDSATGRYEVSSADPASATKHLANSPRTC